MSNRSSQQVRPGEAREKREGGAAASRAMEELPMESSPYVKYADVEEYKRHGYGTEGHQQPVDRPSGGGGTDAPTVSGSGHSEGEARASDGGLHHRGNP